MFSVIVNGVDGWFLIMVITTPYLILLLAVSSLSSGEIHYQVVLEISEARLASVLVVMQKA